MIVVIDNPATAERLTLEVPDPDRWPGVGETVNLMGVRRRNGSHPSGVVASVTRAVLCTTSAETFHAIKAALTRGSDDAS